MLKFKLHNSKKKQEDEASLMRITKQIHIKCEPIVSTTFISFTTCPWVQRKKDYRATYIRKIMWKKHAVKSFTQKPIN